MLKYFVLALCSLSSLLILDSCNDAPSEVGSVLVIDTLNATTVSSLVDTTILTSSESTLNRAVIFNTGALYIGRTPTTRAATLIRLTDIPDTLGWMTTSNIDSINMLMRPQRFIVGDSTAASNNLAFHVVELNKAFITDSAGSVGVAPRWNDLFSSGITPNAAYFSADSVASFRGQIPLKDTMSDVVIPFTAIGKQMMAAWFVKQGDKIDTNKKKQIFGLGFIPGESSTVIRQFATRLIGNTSLPFIRFKVYYHNRDAKRDSLTLNSGNDASFADADSVARPFVLLQSVVQNSATLNFDVRSIAPTDAILKAQLELTIDTTQFIPNNSTVAPKLNVATTALKGTDKKTYNVAYSSGIKSGSDKVSYANVGQALDYVRSTNGGKGSFVIYAGAFDMERHALYGMDAPLDKRPKLVITYAKRPNIGARK